MKRSRLCVTAMLACEMVTSCSQDNAPSVVPTVTDVDSGTAALSLSMLTVSAGQLSPAFHSATKEYGLSVPSDVPAVSLIATASDPGATLEVSQDAGAPQELHAGQPSSMFPVPLTGSSAIKVIVRTTQTMAVYEIAMTRLGDRSTDATLSALVPSAGAFLNAFAPTVTNYTVHVPPSNTTLTLTPISANAAASIHVNGALVTSGQASPPFPVPSDGSEGTVTVDVAAGDSTTKATYTVKVVAEKIATIPTVHSIGDSTMALYSPAATPNQRGWMQLFPAFVKGGLEVDDAGVNGTSTKSFYGAYWFGVKGRINVGDYVFIQFGHNDEKDGGIEGASGVGTEAHGAYQSYLAKYVTEARALGAIPVLLTPVVRLGWSGASLTPVACHDLTGNGKAIGDANYPAAMREVATQLGVPLIDLTASTRALVEQYGPGDAKSILYISTDDTHLQPMGAATYAGLAVQGLIAQNILTDYLNPALGLKTSDTALDFGSRWATSKVEQSFSVYGLSLMPSEGAISVVAPAGFAVSSGTNLPGPTLQIPYTRGALPPTTVRVQFQPLDAAAPAGSLTLTAGASASANLTLTGKSIELPAGAALAEVRYPLDTETSGGACTATGAVTCTEERFSNLYTKDYGTITDLVPMPSTVTVQRVSILDTVVDTWPMESDVNAQRYLEFAVAPAPGKTLRLDNLSFSAGASSNPNLGLRVRTSVEGDFGAPVEVLNAASNPINTLNDYSFDAQAVVPQGSTYRVRIYPYAKLKVKPCYLGLQSVEIHGATY